MSICKNNPDQDEWLKIGSGRGILIYSALQGLNSEDNATLCQKNVASRHVRPAKIQISLHTAQSDLNLTVTGYILEAKDAKFLHVPSEDSDQTAS